MGNLLKPVIYLEIKGKGITERFHWAQGSPATSNFNILSFEYEDTDGTDRTTKKKKGKRDMLKFTFRDFDPGTQTFLTDSSLFAIGNLVNFHFGFQGELRLSEVRTMRIAKVETSYPEDGEEIATITCYDRSINMHLVQKDKVRPEKKLNGNEEIEYSLSEVVDEVATEDGFSELFIDSKFDSIKTNGWVQKKETNIQFLQRLASEYGAEVYVEGSRKLFFQSKRKAIKEKSWGFLHRGANSEFFNKQRRGDRVVLMQSFTPKVNVEKASNEIVSRDVSSKGNVQIEAKSQENTEQVYKVDFDTGELTKSSVGQVVAVDEAKKLKTNSVPRTTKDAKAKADADQQQNAEATLTANANTWGHPELKAKTTIFTSGRLGRKWVGKRWYISSCKHRIDSNGYFCELELTSPPKIASSVNANKPTKKSQDRRKEVVQSEQVDFDTGKFTNKISREKL